MLRPVTRMFGRLIKSHRGRILAFICGFLFAICVFIAINAALELFSKPEYCGGKCHEMNTSYLTWELSPHASNKQGIRIGCTDCHLPPKDKYFRYVTAKAYEGARDIYQHYFGPGYNREKIRQRVIKNIPSKRCLNCHNSLLANPSSPAARIAHLAALERPEKPEKRCVVCHENSGHEREEKLFRP